MEVTSSIYLDQWFSTRSGFASQGTVGSIWRNLWLAQLGGWSWHLVDRSQESYSTFYSAQDRSSETKNYSAQNVQNANVEKLWSRSPYIYAFLKLHQPLSSRANSWVFEFLFIDWFLILTWGLREPRSPAVEASSPNHCTTREFPYLFFFFNVASRKCKITFDWEN